MEDKCIYDGVNTLSLPNMDISKFGKQLDSSLKQIQEASINICAEYDQGALSRVLISISRYVYTAWGSNYIPSFVQKGHRVIIPTSPEDNIAAYQEMIKADKNKLVAIDARTADFIKSAILKSVNNRSKELHSTNLGECSSGIETWNRVYKEVYLRCNTYFASGFTHSGLCFAPRQSHRDSPKPIYENRMALLYKQAHLIGECFTDEQMELYKEYLAFLTVHGMSTSGVSTHDIASLSEKAYQTLNLSPVNKNPTRSRKDWIKTSSDRY